MIKGVSKQILEVTNTENPYFEKIIFFVKPEYKNEDRARLQKEAEKLLPDLDRPAVESLCRLGRGLGRYDGEGESLLLKTAAAELREHLSRAEAENIRLGKLYRTLGLTVGAFLILVLI